MLEWIILILNVIIILVLIYPLIIKKKTSEGYSIFDDILESVVRANTPDIETPQPLPEAEKEEDPCKTIKPIIANRQKELRNLLKIASDLECKIE